ncbi:MULTISPECIES: tetratricopeptide repeat protein [unclassified Lysobacter]|uniref:tetratricopeptide repeat protein n=1 Tax=unclassified Lysobacter TaxID=2635362 RepID=UPI001BEA45CD|nr:MULTISPECIES: tetratricopeptide repeat protein [unclassified Lysobacter]MBT2747415.1 tetratricopeptide repeat protein [Lysobacter sp. ISL-42]MBT2750826.1 tetratricopeptide repeat protein [Lysobacter sp. ISL-50]MBT2778287.1 tetratricopeptide repeat protein [Lysobacter sp. ISL-54]MBT2784049.1 tetratricopeptide repeat protein [Lysobacter sp. ISL-52]
MPKPRSARERADLINTYANRLSHRGDEARALNWYEQATQADPAWAAPWFNIGLVHKYRGEWAQSLAANRQALERDGGHQGACWNLGIAATALHDWPSAREAWRRYGIPLPEGEGPIETQGSLGAVRIDPEGNAEVVWCDRIDPARGRIRNVPFPGSGHRYADIVLHDGAANGRRRIGENEYPVFDELELWRASPYSTFEAWIATPAPELLSTLAERIHRGDGQIEDWTQSVRYICAACSQGDPVQAHDHPVVDDSSDTRWIGLAAVEETMVRAAIDDWLGEHPEASLVEFRCSLAAGVTD